MMTMKRLTIAFLILGLNILCALPSAGQVSFQSYDPVGDSVVVARMRAKMDRIRRRRPTVALVLSGGGAKGGSGCVIMSFIPDEVPPANSSDFAISGGTVIASGTPEEICKHAESYTGQYLKPYLQRKTGATPEKKR